MNNSIVNLINKKIAKLEREVTYFENKSDLDTFYRDKQFYVNTDDWVSYWLELAEYKAGVIEEYYTLLKIVNKQGIGHVTFPTAPQLKVLVNES